MLLIVTATSFLELSRSENSERLTPNKKSHTLSHAQTQGVDVSFHLSQTLPITDQTLLETAIRQLGFELTQHEAPVAVRGWRDEILPTQCELVITRESSRKGADIGFHRTADGSFTIASDEYANSDLGEFIRSLKRTYQEHKAIRTAQANGLRVLSRGKWVTRDGQRFLQLKVGR
jgi:hypothetical protein